MGKTIANVLVGVATLFVRQPNDAIAEWSTEQRHVGDYSAKLYKSGSGNAGSTHVQFTPPAGITMQSFDDDPTDYSFWYHNSAVTGNFVQFELKFEDPNSDAWAELTIVTQQGHTGLAAWNQQVLVGTDLVGWGGVGELGASFFDWSLAEDITGIVAAINLNAAVTDCGDWILTRVRCELWEATPERTSYIDSVEINGITYAIEPGAATSGLSLSSPFTEVGYTEDGVTLEYSSSEADIEVEEETFPIDRVLTKEDISVTCNMAESSLFNIDKAMAGSVLSGNILKLGGGVNKTMNLKIEGTNPAGFLRAIHIPLATASGTVGMSYKKGTKTIVPVTFKALKGESDACIIVDNVA